MSADETSEEWFNRKARERFLEKCRKALRKPADAERRLLGLDIQDMNEVELRAAAMLLHDMWQEDLMRPMTKPDVLLAALNVLATQPSKTKPFWSYWPLNRRNSA